MGLETGMGVGRTSRRITKGAGCATLSPPTRASGKAARPRHNGNRAMEGKAMRHNESPLWEVFIRSQHGLAHKHVGSLHAADAEMAFNNARDVDRKSVG